MVGISLPSTTNIGGLSLRTGLHVEGQYNKSKFYYVATSICNAITEIAYRWQVWLHQRMSLRVGEAVAIAMPR